MIFNQIRDVGCLSYLIACEHTHAGVLIDPNIHDSDTYLSLANRDGITIRYIIDTHTHADHFSASRELCKRLGVQLVMHRGTSARLVGITVDDGEMIVAGSLQLKVIHTPGHTADSVCILAEDRLFTGDTLLIGGAGRTDLPTGDSSQLYHSLFEKVLKLPDETRIYPAHDYHGRESSTIGEQKQSNPRLAVKNEAEFVELMASLNLDMPTHLTEALRVNLSGGVSIDELLRNAAGKVPFMGQDQVNTLIESNEPVKLLDVREKDAFEAGHLPGAIHLPRGQLELRVNEMLPDPTERIVVYCEFGKISTLAAATLRELGYLRAVAMANGVEAWKSSGYRLD